MKQVALSLADLHKTYPNGQKAISGVSLAVTPSTIFGLIGPNGAGKSTLLKLASGLLSPDSGSVNCGDQNVSGQPREAARFVGLMPDPLGVYTDVTAKEYLEFFARLLEIPERKIPERIDKVVEQLELGRWLDVEVETLSAGWQRRLALGRVLLYEAPVLLLDEPAAGLDISARQELLTIIRSLGARGHTIIVSSHILPELEELADCFGVLNDGRWVEISAGKTFFTREDLRIGFGGAQWIIACDHIEDAVAAIAASGATKVERTGDGVIFSALGREQAASALAAVVQRGCQVHDFRRQQIELNELVRKVLEGGDND